MARIGGRTFGLSLPRRWVGDLLAVSASNPLITFERRMNLAAVAEARAAATPKPAWSLLFTKAYALVSQRRPELRRAYIPWPRPHLFEAETSLAALAIEREFAGEPAVFFGLIRTPDRQALPDLVGHLERWQRDPIESLGDFRRLLRMSRWPRMFRRALWYYGLNTSGERRAKHFGTFGVSVTAGLGAAGKNLISPLTTTLNYSPFDADYNLDVRLHFDHRVLDGAVVARAMTDLESTLNTEILAELHSLSGAGQPIAHRRVSVISR